MGLPISFERFAFLELREISVQCFLVYPSFPEQFLDSCKSEMEENSECFFARRHGDVIVFFHAIELERKMPRVVISGGGLWAWQVTAHLLLLMLGKTGPNKMLIFLSRTIIHVE